MGGTPGGRKGHRQGHAEAVQVTDEGKIVHLYRGKATALANEIAAGTLVPQLRQRFAERML